MQGVEGGAKSYVLRNEKVVSPFTRPPPVEKLRSFSCCSGVGSLVPRSDERTASVAIPIFKEVIRS